MIYTTETAFSASFLGIYLKFDTNGRLSTRYYDKRNDYNLVNFHLLIVNVQYDTKLKRQCKKTFSSEKSNRDTKVGNTKRNIAVVGGL